MEKVNVNKEPGSAGKSRQSTLNALPERNLWFLRQGYVLLWFAIAAFLLFGQTVSFNYTYLDDQTLILNNMDNLKSTSYISKAFSEDVFHSPSLNGYYYRPVLTLSFMADAMTGKGSFAMFHFSNIVYHILATFLLFLFFVATGYDRTKSFLFGLIFLVHPMITQAVAWVPGRNDSLLAIFILGAFTFWLKYLKTGSSKYLLFHLLFYVIALLTKENAVVLPVMIILYSSLLLRTPVKKYFSAGAGWAIITIIWATVRYNALGGANELPFSTQLFSIFKSLPAVLPFLGKALFPFDLSVFPIFADMKVSTVLGIVAIGVLVSLAWITKPKQWFYYFFGILWFIAFLVPSFVTLNNQIPNFSEHRSYLSLAGILIFFMGCGPVKKANFSHKIPLLFLGGLLLLFTVLTFLHTRHFRDQFAFWQNAVDSSPSHAFNYNNLGAMYFLKGEFVQAEPYFRKALKINPVEPMANSNTGLICMNTDRPDEAEKYYLEEIRINPNYDHVYYNLGLLYYNHGRPEEGLRQWEKTLTINPTYVDAYKALLFAYEKMDRKADYDRIVTKARENGVIR
ncbi:MAG: tetratricopeptide repeat protein [Bacteroidetes bacterium]|nr:tetratricopeptide repeat protein [Bacteroidota bacterium]